MTNQFEINQAIPLLAVHDRAVPLKTHAHLDEWSPRDPEHNEGGEMIETGPCQRNAGLSTLMRKSPETAKAQKRLSCIDAARVLDAMTKHRILTLPEFDITAEEEIVRQVENQFTWEKQRLIRLSSP
jgi:hypothetical protein